MLLHIPTHIPYSLTSTDLETKSDPYLNPQLYSLPFTCFAAEMHVEHLYSPSDLSLKSPRDVYLEALTDKEIR
jgi:hypothetical protein